MNQVSIVEVFLCFKVFFQVKKSKIYVKILDFLFIFFNFEMFIKIFCYKEWKIYFLMYCYRKNEK